MPESSALSIFAPAIPLARLINDSYKDIDKPLARPTKETTGLFFRRIDYAPVKSPMKGEQKIESLFIDGKTYYRAQIKGSILYARR
jgi:hypothetical protein